MSNSLSNELYMSATGQPFTDPDAACAKATIMSRETGAEYIVIEHPDGGYAVKTDETVPYIPITVDKPVEYDDMAVTQEQLEPTDKNVPFTPLSNEVEKTPVIKKYPATIKTHPSWMSHWVDLVACVVGIIITLAPTGFVLLFIEPSAINEFKNWDRVSNSIRALGTLMAIYTISRAWLDILANRYRVTLNRVHTAIGIVRRQEAQVRLSHIRTIDLNQNFVDRILNIGTLQFASAGTSGIDVAFKKVASPQELKEEIERRVDSLDSRDD